MVGDGGRRGMEEGCGWLLGLALFVHSCGDGDWSRLGQLWFLLGVMVIRPEAVV